MKRLLLTALIATATLASISAQYPEYGFGARAGAMWSHVDFYPHVAQPSWPATWHAGLKFRMVSERYFGFALELNYAQRGFTDKVEGASTHRRLDYIEMPFLTHITFGRRLFRFNINAGPTISYMILDHKSTTSTLPQHTLPVANRFDYGISAGLEFEFNTRHTIICVDGRYNFGLGNLFKSTAGNAFSNSYNQTVTASLSIMIPYRPNGYDRDLPKRAKKADDAEPVHHIH